MRGLGVGGMSQGCTHGKQCSHAKLGALGKNILKCAAISLRIERRVCNYELYFIFIFVYSFKVGENVDKRTFHLTFLMHHLTNKVNVNLLKQRSLFHR